VAAHLEDLEKSGNLRVAVQGSCDLAYGQLPRVLILTQNVQKKELVTRYSCASHEVYRLVLHLYKQRLSHWSLLTNIVVIKMLNVMK